MKLFILFLVFFTFPLAAKTTLITGYPDRPIIERESKRPTDKLVILLHAIKTSARFIDLYYPLSSLMNQYDFNLVVPSGSKNIKGQRYWSAGEACCDFYNDGANDLEFLDKLITHYKKKYKSDKIYLIGHSNGGFMANHYACYGKHAIKGFFSFAGNPSPSLANCTNLNKIKAIHAHGTKDTFVPYYGGPLNTGGHNSIPVASYLAEYENTLGCSPLEYVSQKNFTFNRPGKDFNIYKAKNCLNGNQLIFWDHFNGGHIPRFNKRYLREIIKNLF